MNDHQVRAIKRFVQIQSIRVILAAAQSLIDGVEIIQRPVAVIAQEILQTPIVARLVHQYVVVSSCKLGCDSAQEVGVSMIPVGNERMIEEYNFHRR